MMNKKPHLICMILVLMFILCSCQLARTDGLDIKNGDRLVGVFITKEYLSLDNVNRQFNWNGTSYYISDATYDIPPDYVSQVVFPEDDPFHGRIYATLKEDAWGDMEYVFEDLDGIPFFYAEYESIVENSENYRQLSSDSRINEPFISNKDVDGVVSLALEGKVYFSSDVYKTMDASDRVFRLYKNPVYQDGEGLIYLKGGRSSGLGESPGSASVGSTIEETNFVVINGKKTEQSTKVDISMQAKDPGANIRIIQMNDQDTLVSQEKYTDLTMPENINIPSDTEYVIFETHTSSSDGVKIKREIFSRGDNHFYFYKACEDGFLVKVGVNLLWK